MKNIVITAFMLLFLVGCVSTNEVALAPNVLRIDADATGYGYGNSYSSFNANTNTNVWRAPIESTSMMIMMFKADDEIPSHAWEAREVLAKEGKI